MPDFFSLSKTIPLFLNPLPLFLLFLMVFSIVVRRSSGSRWILLSAIVFWTISTPWFADQLARWWEEPRKADVELPAHIDVAIVLGGMSNALTSNKEHLEFGSSSERLLEAIHLYKAGRVSALLITSGSGDLMNQEATEAPDLAAFALQWGVSPADLVVESKSRNTRENASLSLPLLKNKGWKSAVLITSAWHMKRAAGVFRKAGYTQNGLKLALWPVDTRESRRAWPLNFFPDEGCLETTQILLREVVGWAVYGTQGYL
jgi:uncharacterized SAM-binding protein YcdF (DUF218 family)